jgi:tetratricopeptide (TPR) repeat protein
MIIKPDNKEAKLLDRALSYVAPYVDEICITQAGNEKNEKVSSVIEKHGGKESFFKWTKDFSQARNFNFSQAAGDYLFWIDADDVVKGAEFLPNVVKRMEEDKVDTVVMNYLYDFDEDSKKCTVKHLKTRIVKKDVVKWVGEVHEDFEPLRELKPMMVDEIEILHITNEKRAKQSAVRNLDIAKKYLENHPNDPWSDWLMANALMSLKKEKQAIKFYEKFIHDSNSKDNNFIAYLRLGDTRKNVNDYLGALSIRPDYPDAYLKIGELYYNQKEFDLAKRFILVGLQIKKPDTQVIVYNPRDYDFNPLMILSKVFVELKEYSHAIRVLERCVKIIPDHPVATETLGLLKKFKDNENKVDDIIENAKTIDKDKLKEYLDNVPVELKSHPKLAVFRNFHIIKTESTGKDIAYYCGHTDFEWYPGAKRMGGSEEAVVNLAKNWKEQGYNVTVFNNCGNVSKIYDGVEYKPYWEYNSKDKYDVLVVWRHPRPVDFEHNATKIFVDVHDVLGVGEFTQDRLEKIDKVFFKTKAHRNLYNIPDEKVCIVPNGVDPEQFNHDIVKNPYLILNTSSPDRHLDATLDIFEELIRKQPDKPWKLAWYYGWDNFLAWNKDHKVLMDFYRKQSSRFQKLVDEGRAEGGISISQEEIAKKYLEAGIFLYPTQFFEIHCISAVKAQLAGCRMITSDFAALNETVKDGYKVHTDGRKWGKEDTFGDTDNINAYVNCILGFNIGDNTQWAKSHAWNLISKKWTNEIQDTDNK